MVNIIPIGYYKYPTVCSNAAFQIADADLYLFGILNSSMHMAWVKTVAGRLKGDYRYSNTIVYNNFIFPEVTDKQREIIEKKSSVILNVREKYSESTLADLYDPLSMPVDLLKAHQSLNKSVDQAYGKKFTSDEERVAELFRLYQHKVIEEVGYKR